MSRGQALLGRTCGAVGFVGLVLGAAGAAPSFRLLGAPGSLVLVVSGGALLGAGLVAWLSAREPERVPAPAVSAAKAFASRMTTPSLDPVPVGAARPALPDAAAPEPPSERARLDERIRDLTRRINRAGVMLATGQLSQQGYARYVEDLKKERGALEADRVSLELGGKP